MQGAEQPEVLVGRRDDLVLGREAEPCEDDVAAVGRRRRQCDLLGLAADQLGEPCTELGAQREDPFDVLAAGPSFGEVPLLLHPHRVRRRPS